MINIPVFSLYLFDNSDIKKKNQCWTKELKFIETLWLSEL